MDMPNDIIKFQDEYVACEYCGRELTPEEIEDYGTICEQCIVTDEQVRRADIEGGER